MYAVPAEITADIPLNVRGESLLERRKLSASELDELKQHIKQFRRPPVAMLVFLAWSGLAIIAGFMNRNKFYAWLQEYKIGIFIVVISTIWQLYQFVNIYITSRALEADHQVGWIIIMQGKEPLSESSEYLSISRVPWSVNGKPTEWRLKKASRSAN